MTYLVEAAICLSAFYLIYWLFLRNETFHKLIRCYLVATLSFSMVIPLLRWDVRTPGAPPSVVQYTDRLRHGIERALAFSPPADRFVEEGVETGGASIGLSRDQPAAGASSNFISFTGMLFAFYLLGAAFLLFRLAVQARCLLRIKRRGRKTRRDGVLVAELEEAFHPCSFLNTVLICPRSYSPADLKRIVRHERVHIDQQHWIDNILVQAVAVTLWFNPFAWLYKRALASTHEYLADAAACRGDEKGGSYQALLLKELIGLRRFDLADGFNLRPMEKRIAMMTKQRSRARARLKVLVVLPVIAFLFMLFILRFVPAVAEGTALAFREKEAAMKTETDPYAPIVLHDAESIFNRILMDMDRKDWIQRSYIYTRLACMRAAGWTEIDYATLMTVSGYGLTFAYHPKEHSGAHFWPPPGTDERITRATGFGWEGRRFEDIEQCWRFLKESIDSGRPLHGPHMEEVLFVGYQEAARKKDRKVRPMAIWVFVDPGIWWSWREFEKWFKEFGGYLGHFTERVDKLTDKETAKEVMNALVELAHEDPRSERPRLAEVKWGLAGIEAFIEDMEDLSKKERHFCSGWFGCHDSNPQWMARQHTGEYLKRSAALFNGTASALMREAAGEYEAAHEAWLVWDKHLGRHSGKHAWRDKNLRLAGAEAAREALAHERRAVEKIGIALTQIQ